MRANVSKAFNSSSNNSFIENDANELILMNSTILDEVTSSLAPKSERLKAFADYTDNINFDSNESFFPYRIGQTVVNPKITVRENEDGSSDYTPAAEGNINIQYSGFGYDTGFVTYSGIDETKNASGVTNINQDSGDSKDAVTWQGQSDYNTILGYDTRLPLQNQEGSRSVSRMGLYPGLFRKKKEGGNFVGDAQERIEKYFDVAHKIMPTGSLDLFGTVRLREQETTDNGEKDGWVAINKKNGIVGFEEPNKIGVPTGMVVMFSELSSDKFSFVAQSRVNLGYTASNKTARDFITGGTGQTAAFPGKGSQDLKDYYICNGAVLADSRDIMSTGPFSKMEGMNVNANGVKITNGTVSSGTNSPWDYTTNDDFIGIDNEESNSDIRLGQSNNGETLVSLYNNFGNNISKSEPYWGYSIVAPIRLESGFRIVLPNYFGKVAKMVFPDSDYIVKAISGTRLANAEVTALGQDDPADGFKYYTSGTEYNASWMMRGMFDIGGFPYLVS